MKTKLMILSLFFLSFISCDLIFNSFNEQKFKGTYKIETKELINSTEEVDPRNKFFAMLVKLAMSDMALELTFGDNKKGSIKFEGTAVALMELFSNDFTKTKEISYYIKSDSILMVDFGFGENAGYQKLGTVRSYDKDYNRILLYVSGEKNSKMGSLVTMKRIF